MTSPLPIFNGTRTVQLTGENLSFKPFSGGSAGGTFKGDKAIVGPMVNAFKAYGYSVDYKYDESPIATLTFSSSFSASSGGGAATNPNLDFADTWELVRNTVQKELLESDHPLVSELSSNDFAFLKSIFLGETKIVPGTIAGFFDGTGTAGIIPGGGTWTTAYSIAAAIYLYELFTSGVKTVPVKQPILRLTRTTNPLYYAPFYTGNIDHVLSTATMLADSGVPGSFSIPLLSLANDLISKSGGTLAQARTDGLNLKFGWY